MDVQIADIWMHVDLVGIFFVIDIFLGRSVYKLFLNNHLLSVSKLYLDLIVVLASTYHNLVILTSIKKFRDQI